MADDGRTLVADRTDSPYEFIGRWFITRSDGVNFGSGVLLGANYVLTAGHILADLISNGISASFTPAYNWSGQAVDAPFGATNYDRQRRSTGVDFPTQDIGIAAVDRDPIPLNEIPGMVLFMNPADFAGDPVLSAGYPGDLAPIDRNNLDAIAGQMYQISGRIDSALQNGQVFLSDTMTTAEGQSGGPIFYTDKAIGKLYTAGVIYTSEPTDPGPGVGTIFTPDIYAQYMTFLTSTEGSIDPRQLPSNLIVGSSSGNTIKLGHRTTKVVGGSGSDTIYAGIGFDELDGGGGNNTVRYDVNPLPSIEGDSAAGAPTVFQNLVVTIQVDGAGLPQTIATFDDQFGQTTQTLKNIENLVLTTSADKVVVAANGLAALQQIKQVDAQEATKDLR
jgi:V8-like Glu-specific endopeptidase